MKFTLTPKLVIGLAFSLLTLGSFRAAENFEVPQSIFSEIVIADSLKIYPNPAKDRLYFKGLEDGKDLRINIYDVLGKLVIDSNVSNQNISNGLDISKLNRGIYLVKMDDGSQTVTQKLIKE
ncbi:MAG: T9SS type A sorting domain-containing protein [Leeuwenhoekiella sp.]